MECIKSIFERVMDGSAVVYSTGMHPIRKWHNPVKEEIVIYPVYMYADWSNTYHFNKKKLDFHFLGKNKHNRDKNWLPN